MDLCHMFNNNLWSDIELVIFEDNNLNVNEIQGIQLFSHKMLLYGYHVAILPNYYLAKTIKMPPALINLVCTGQIYDH